MKVLIITGSVKETSGWGRHSRAIVEQLLARNIEVEVFAEEIAEDLPCPWKQLMPLHSGFSVWAFLKNIRAVRRAAKKFDIVHALDGWPFAVYGNSAVRHRKNAKFFINGVGTYSVAPLYSFWKKRLLRRAYDRAQKIFCISNYSKRLLEEAGVPQEKLVTVHYGTPSLPQLTQEEQRGYGETYAIPPTAFPIILTVGAIKDRKGQMETLQAVQLLHQKYPHILYIMAGIGNAPHYIEALEKYADLHGFLDHIRIVSGADDRGLSFLYSIATVFALNSNSDVVSKHFEGFGAVILEACLYGKPAVGSRNSGIEDAIEDGKSGLLTEQRNPNDIAQKIEQILARYDFFCENAKLWSANFSWEKTVAAYIDFYSK
jgi:phosphatidylinositol alpha-1,6-mannosyltransferase